GQGHDLGPRTGHRGRLLQPPAVQTAPIERSISEPSPESRALSVAAYGHDLDGVIFDLARAAGARELVHAVRAEPEPHEGLANGGARRNRDAQYVRALTGFEVIEDAFLRIGPIAVPVEIRPR